MRVRLVEEQSRPDGRVQRFTNEVDERSRIGSMFVGQGRAVRVTVDHADGSQTTWTEDVERFGTYL